MRFEELQMQDVPCTLCNLNDAEALEETQTHNRYSSWAFTKDPRVLAMQKEVEDSIPDVDAMLKDSPVPEVGGDGKPAEADKSVIEKQRKEIKAETPPNTVKLFCIIP